ncbi:mycofactocin precursor MftA [Streptomyces sp. NBC_00841]|uniref:mycofactocin precursor MftA n=1 Tax=unclassified Streptomyces TaxID=2593676 RepID=UPI0022573648|nr:MULTISPECIES: mycofactocin precursor MftA [unclassified Streptomyces]MCX4530886.1 mycofactocin precursor MftA [Streptomyces sp. NBC_01669]WSA03368.1 mycofactocin precursor MftA [Streptomyces sp. NBC_00841]
MREATAHTINHTEVDADFTSGIVTDATSGLASQINLPADGLEDLLVEEVSIDGMCGVY